MAEPPADEDWPTQELLAVWELSNLEVMPLIEIRTASVDIEWCRIGNITSAITDTETDGCAYNENG